MASRRPEAYVSDILEACKFLEQFFAGKTGDDYRRDRMLSSAIERQFEVIGEACSQLFRIRPDYRSKITDSKRIVGFRNLLIHGYFYVDANVVLGVLKDDLPKLKNEAEALLKEIDPLFLG